jgi:hypothetical protein
LFCRWKSRSEAGRPKIPQAQINLIKQMANDKPLWGAPRIHGEMLKLGFDISSQSPPTVHAQEGPKDYQAALEDVSGEQTVPHTRFLSGGPQLRATLPSHGEVTLPQLRFASIAMVGF